MYVSIYIYIYQLIYTYQLIHTYINYIHTCMYIFPLFCVIVNTPFFKAFFRQNSSGHRVALTSILCRDVMIEWVESTRALISSKSTFTASMAAVKSCGDSKVVSGKTIGKP